MNEDFNWFDAVIASLVISGALAVILIAALGGPDASWCKP